MASDPDDPILDSDAQDVSKTKEKTSTRMVISRVGCLKVGI
jgi:hypothetical protein